MPKLLLSGQEVSEQVLEIVENQENIYDFTFKAGKRELSGIMVTRPAENGGTRVVAATYFGLSLFDITIYKSSHKVNSCAEFLDNDRLASFIASRLRRQLEV